VNVAGAGTETDREHALVPVHAQTRAPALLRIPLTLTLLGLFLISVQAGKPILGFAVMLTALLSTATLAWKSLSRRYAPALMLRDQGDANLLQGRYVEARDLYERSLAIVQRELPPAAPEVLLNYYSLAAVNSMLHDHELADRYLYKLLDGLDHRVPAPWTGHVAWLLRRVAHHHCLAGRHAQAIDLCERAIELVGDAPGADDNTVRSLVDDLAWIHHHAGDYATAERLFRDALALHEQFRDAAIDAARRPVGRPTGSESPYRVPGPMAAPTTGGLDRAVAYSLLGLGWTVYERGQYEEARAQFDRANMTVASLPPSASEDARPPSPSTEPRSSTCGLAVEILRGRAAVDMTLGDYDAAAKLYADARARIGSDETLVQSAALAIDLGWLARCRERFDEAEASYQIAQQAVEQRSEGMATIACALHEGMAELRRRQGRFRDAHRHIQRAISLAAECLGGEHPRVASILAIASRVHTARSELSDAERCARQCLVLLRASLGRTHPRLADGHVALGEMHLARGQYGAAEQAFAQAQELRETMLGIHHPELVEVLDGRSAVLRATAREEEATHAEARAEVIRQRVRASAPGGVAS
jgi:tetratricopeptide (TPR) repeat protein